MQEVVVVLVGDGEDGCALCAGDGGKEMAASQKRQKLNLGSWYCVLFWREAKGRSAASDSTLWM